MPDSLLIIGASARAAAASARRSGFDVVAIDQFADADLRQIGDVRNCERYPHDLARIANQFPPTPWIYCGGLENHPDVIEAISRRHPLLGTSAPVVRRIRDPFLVATAFTERQVPHPRVAKLPPAGSAPAEWLEKSRRSTAGCGVRRLGNASAGDVPPQSDDDPDRFFQEFRSGNPISALFLADREVHLVGVTTQLIGRVFASPGEFQYAGSIGPTRLNVSQRQSLERAAQALCDGFHLRGIFGVDAILDPSGAIWPIEVNPRYCASVEIIERASTQNLVDLHVAACRGNLAAPHELQMDICFGKLIVFASAHRVVPDSLSKAWCRRAMRTDKPDLADVPTPGTIIAAGDPVATVFAEASDPSQVAEMLQVRRRRLLDELDRAQPSSADLR